MGSVWVAEHLGLQSQVAVKFMAPAMLDDPVSVARFRQEAKAAAEIRSPHVVRVFDHGVTEDQHHYIVMELLHGESLERRVKRVGPMDVRELLAIMIQVCKALAQAHQRGIIHRDIKPANIFLIDSDDELFVKVLDFGVAKFSGEEAINMTAVGNMVGTPAYMSPEQLFHGKSVDHRGDLWSLGVVAYHALTGVRPFKGVTLGELCVAIKAAEFTPPGSLRNDLVPDIDAWFARALNGDPEGRFRSAKEMAQALEHAVGVSSTMGSSPSLVASSPHVATFPGTAISSHPALASPTDKSRTVAAVVAACVLVSGVVAGVLFLSRGGAQPAQPAQATASPSAAAQPSQTSRAVAASPPSAKAPQSASSPSTLSASDSSSPVASASAADSGSVAAPATKAPVKTPRQRSGKGGPGDDRATRAGKALGI